MDISRILVYVFAFFVIIGMLGIITDYTSASRAVATAPARVVTETFETDNVITNYEWFFDVHASFVAKVSDIRAHSALIETETDAGELRRLRVEFVGMQQMCRMLVTKYNANSRKANVNIFKGRSTPEKLEMKECEVL